jgi:transcriptional regulator with XRE-family HTH domain
MRAALRAARRLEDWMHHQQKTQADVATALKVTQATVSRWTAVGIPTKHWDTVARLMGTTPADLVRSDDDRPRIVPPSHSERVQLHALIDGVPEEELEGLTREVFALLMARHGRGKKGLRRVP